MAITIQPKVVGSRIGKLSPGELIVLPWRNRQRYAVFSKLYEDGDPGIVILDSSEADGVNADVVVNGPVATYGHDWSIGFDPAPHNFYFPGDVGAERPGSLLLGENGPAAIVLKTPMGRRNYFLLDSLRTATCRERPSFSGAITLWSIQIDKHTIVTVEAGEAHSPS